MKDFRKCLFFRAILSVLLLSVFSHAENASSVGKVRYILGEVTVQKKAGDNWNPLRIGLKVKSHDLIRTLVESEAGIALSDGSLVTIEENTTIRFETAVSNQSENSTMIDLRSGRLFFDVQKQKPGDKFEFRTGSATAAIRGTNGFVESGPEGIVVSLETGKMLVTDSAGNTLEVEGGETLVQEKGKGLQKFKTPSSGSKGLAKEISAERKDGNFNAENLKKNAEKLDESNKKALDELGGKMPCTVDPIPAKTTESEIKVTGKCDANARAEVNGLAATPAKNGRFSATVSFDKNSYGEKRIRVKSLLDSTAILCYEGRVEYIEKTPNDDNAFIRIQKDEYASNDSRNISVKGEFFSEDAAAKVIVSIGKLKSANLNSKSANGHFAYMLPLESSFAKNGEAFIKATLKTKKRTLTDSIRISFPPTVRITAANEDRCEISFALKGIGKKPVQVEEFIDGIPTAKATFHQDVTNASFPMLSGKHLYKIVVTDESGSRSEALKTSNCKE